MSLDAVQDKFQKELGAASGTRIKLQDTDGTALQSDLDLEAAVKSGCLPLQALPYSEAQESLTRSMNEALGIQWRFIREVIQEVLGKVDNLSSNLHELEEEL